MNIKIDFNKIFLLIFSILGLTSCDTSNIDCIRGEESITTQVLSLSDFDGINLHGSENVRISQGLLQEVKVIGNSNIIENLRTSVSNNIWDIRLEAGCYRNYKLAIEIIVPNIKHLEINGSGNIIVNDFEDQNNLNIEINGSGNISLNQFEGLTNFDANLNGSGFFKANYDIYTLENLSVNNRGRGNFFGFKLNTDNCIINSIGVGSIKVTATQLLDVRLTGRGDVFYKGTPEIKQNIMGTGNLINAN
ncbi:head GIN domain-containing protein [Polaribacter sp. Hel1_85]|uniref:head GIN domain-containing protein n=1 Tax=Polaribacter sp. Hel1_85 TaxID=1250005 RepID=UPI00052DAF4A|nr:head GIN domain-containing protein [Polaribacter sp. Hel1_85]KGL61722.1 hypothetical protein PHEL85_1503 [Polaribacter sp. Hel1_85]